jgi:hypothetical protein
MILFASENILRWEWKTMADEQRQDEGISLRVNKTFRLNRRSRIRLWRWTQATLATLLTAGSVTNWVDIKLTRKSATQEVATIKQVVDEKDKEKDVKIEALIKEIQSLTDVWGSHLIWLESEKRFLRSPGSRKRFEDEIIRLRQKMKPIGRAEPGIHAAPLLPYPSDFIPKERN